MWWRHRRYWRELELLLHVIVEIEAVVSILRFAIGFESSPPLRNSLPQSGSCSSTIGQHRSHWHATCLSPGCDFLERRICGCSAVSGTFIHAVDGGKFERKRIYPAHCCCFHEGRRWLVRIRCRRQPGTVRCRYSGHGWVVERSPGIVERIRSRIRGNAPMYQSNGSTNTSLRGF